MSKDVTITGTGIVYTNENSKTGDITVQVTTIGEGASENLDYGALSTQLEMLKAELLRSAKTSQDYVDVANVAKAQDEVTKKNNMGVKTFLSSCSKWVLDTATKIGVSLITDLIKNQMK